MKKHMQFSAELHCASESRVVKYNIKTEKNKISMLFSQIKQERFCLKKLNDNKGYHWMTKAML